MITAALGLDISNFTSKLNAAKGKIADFASSSKLLAVMNAGFTAAAAGIAVAAAGASAAAVGMWNAMDAGGRMVDLQEQTGIGIETLAKLELAFSKIGMGADEVGAVINKLQKSIASAATEGGASLAVFNQLGISIADLTAMSPDQQLLAVGDAIAKIESPAKKAQLAMELFGKSGGKLLPLLASGGLDQAARQLGNQGKLLAENAGVFDRITDVLETASIKVRGFFVGMASAVAPQLLEAVNRFENIDLSGLGQQVGAFLAAFLNPEMWSTLGSVLLDLFTLLSKDASVLFTNALVSAFSVLMSADFWTGMLSVLIGIAQQFTAELLRYIPGMGKISQEMQQRGAQNLGVNLIEKRDFAIAEGTTFSDLFAPLMEQVSKTSELAKTQFPTPAPTGGGAGGEVGLVGAQRAEPIVSSLAKIGGAFGGAFGGTDPQLDQMRTQTTALQGMLGKLDQLIANTKPDGSLGGGLGVATLA
jgi:hypothetical protein